MDAHPRQSPLSLSLCPTASDALALRPLRPINSGPIKRFAESLSTSESSGGVSQIERVEFGNFVEAGVYRRLAFRMGSELVEIEPRELKFTFELKKQSSCCVRLSNKSDEYVAFKVKTTSPKRYCVRPNTGVIPPQSACDFTVTMQAQRTAPPDMQLKDKFLVQSTIVPYGSTDEDIAPTFFFKETDRYIEECKLRVVLVSPPHSPVLQPSNGALKQEQANVAPIFKQSSILKDSPVIKEGPSFKDTLIDDKNIDLSHVKEIEDLKSKINALESKLSEAKDVEDLTSKISTLQSKLSEADNMITMLKEQKNLNIQERDKSQQEIILLRSKAASMVQVGFPAFFVLFIWIVGIAVGYLLRP